MAESWDPNTRSAVQKIPLLSTPSGPRDVDGWQKRLKEVCFNHTYLMIGLKC